MAAVLSGCALLPRGNQGLLEHVPQVNMRPEELRVRVRSLAAPFSGRLETVADQVASSSDAPSVRAEMARFKINAIPQMQSALFRPDPVGALIDAWAFVAQLKQALDARVPASARAREAKALIESTFAGMEGQLERLWSQLSSDPTSPAQVREQVHHWARDHPLTGSIATRQSTESLLAGVTTRSGLNLGNLTGRLSETADDLAARLDVETQYLPKQGRWEAEYLVRTLFNDPTVGDGASLLGDVRDALGVIQGVPGLTDSLRARTFEDLRAERLGAQSFLSGEREQVLQDLHSERVATMTDADRIGRGWIEVSFERTRGLVDRVALWTLALMAAATGAAVIIIRTVRRNPPPLSPRRGTGRAPSPEPGGEAGDTAAVH